MVAIDQSQFFANLRLTQAYCQHQLDQKAKVDWTVLRSTVKPVCKDGKWFAHISSSTNKGPISWAEWTKKSDPYYYDSFVEIFCRQLEFKALVSARLNHDEDCRGRILVIEHGENIPDGAVESETNGFFDEWDLPPIDTWFYNAYSSTAGGILFAWIPEEFTKLADIAIETQFLNILHWFEKPSSWNT